VTAAKSLAIAASENASYFASMNKSVTFTSSKISDCPEYKVTVILFFIIFKY